MKKEFKVDGMNCNHCRMSVENALRSIDGVITAGVTLDPPVAVVEFNENEVSTETLQSRLNKAGDFRLSVLQ